MKVSNLNVGYYYVSYNYSICIQQYIVSTHQTKHPMKLLQQKAVVRRVRQGQRIPFLSDLGWPFIGTRWDDSGASNSIGLALNIN